MGKRVGINTVGLLDYWSLFLILTKNYINKLHYKYNIMIFSKKIVKVGRSSGIIVPSNILKEMGIKNKEFVKITIKKILKK